MAASRELTSKPLGKVVRTHHSLYIYRSGFLAVEVVSLQPPNLSENDRGPLLFGVFIGVLHFSSSFTFTLYFLVFWMPLLRGFIPTCSSGNQNTTSRSAVAHMLYLGFHSTTFARPLHGSPHMGLISLVSTSTWPCVSHTIASLSPPLPPIR